MMSYMNNLGLSLKDYISFTKQYFEAWNRTDAELVASCYNDDLEYRDPLVPHGITNKADFIYYLKYIFSEWPSQNMMLDTLYPYPDVKSFCVNYCFQMANNSTVIRGSGINRVIFKCDKISLNHVFLCTDELDALIKSILKRK